MKKMTNLLSTLLVIGLFSTPAMASDTLNNIVNPDTTKKSSSVKKRRKKVHMCKECGKPETKCECEGEEHRGGKPVKK
jgi:hypothetical protein